MGVNQPDGGLYSLIRGSNNTNKTRMRTGYMEFPRPVTMCSVPVAAPLAVKTVKSLNLSPERKKTKQETKLSATSQSLNLPNHFKRYENLQKIELSEDSFLELIKAKQKPTKRKPPSQEDGHTKQNMTEPQLCSEEEMIINEESCIDNIEIPSEPCPSILPSSTYYNKL